MENGTAHSTLAASLAAANLAAINHGRGGHADNGHLADINEIERRMFAELSDADAKATIEAARAIVAAAL
jgi:hypothetical protein